MNKLSTKTLTSAFALGTLLLLGGATGCADDKTSENQQAVKCFGINECKGLGECSSAEGSNDCQGHNECKGTGWVTVETEEECTSQGGKVI
jgi:uncharacterized membrane protein